MLILRSIAATTGACPPDPLNRPVVVLLHAGGDRQARWERSDRRAMRAARAFAIFSTGADMAEQSKRGRATGKPVAWSARVIANSRSTACAEGKSLTGGLRRNTKQLPPDVARR